MRFHTGRCFAVAALLLGSGVIAQEPIAPTTAPATQPATAPAAVSSAARPLLDQLAGAYAAALPLGVQARATGQFDVAGRSHSHSMEITGVSPDGVRFLHQAAGHGLVVSNGKRGYLYDERRRTYALLEVSETQALPDAVDEAISDILLEENPALLLVLCTEPRRLLERLSTRIDVGPPTAVGGADCPTLVLSRDGDATVSLAIDARTGRIRQSRVDYRPLLQARGATLVKAGEVTVEYQPGESQAVPPEAYDWQPPAGAIETVLPRELLEPVDTPASAPATRPAGEPRE